MAVTALGIILAAGAVPNQALADFPGERWNTPYVQVSGNGDPAFVSAVQSGLKAANETYFYGDRATKMQAILRGPGQVDVRILDASSGKVIAEQRGLSYSGTGRSASASITQSALAWMDRLGCSGGGCQVATIGGSEPQPAVQVAEAPKAEPETAPAASTESAAPQASIAEVAPQPTTAESAPKAPSGTTIQLETLAAAAPEQQQATPSAPVEPTRAEPASKPKETEIAALLPSAGSTSAAPKAATASVPEPSAGAASAPSGSLAAVTAPSTGELTGQGVAVGTPALQEPEPTQPAVPSGARDADAVLAAVAPKPDTEVQNVLPGVVLPQPRPGDAVTPVGALIGAKPDVETDAEAAPSQASELALAEPAATATAPSTQGDAATGDGGVDVGGADQSATSPALETPEPPRAAQPEAVSGTASTDAPATSGTGNDSAFSSPTPVARSPQAAPEAPSAPTAEIAASTPSISASSGAPSVQSEDSALSTPDVEPEQPALAAGSSGEIGAPTVGTSESAIETPEQTASAPSAPAAPAAQPEEPESAVSGEQLALANPQTELQVPQASPALTNPDVGQGETPAAPQAPASDADNAASTAPSPTDDAGPAAEVDVQVASVDPTATGPTLANARWVGFTPAVYSGSDTSTGAWISGPFDRKQRTGWITDTATGATTRVTFVWREGGSGARTAILSRDAASALGLNQGDVANVAVYLPR